MIRFVVDRHLGHLARWLRTLGYDAFFLVDATDDQLRSELRGPGTAFVTTEGDGREHFGARQIVAVPKEDLEKQLKTLRKNIPGSLSERMFTRCVVCNVPVLPASHKEVQGQVPASVFSRMCSFTRCPVCHRIYWEGTHTARLRHRLAALLGEPIEGGGEDLSSPSSGGP